MRAATLSDGLKIWCLRQSEAVVLDHHVEGYLNHGIEVRDGDTITIDVDKRTLDVDLTVSEIDERVAAYIPPANPDRTGVLAKYADQVGSASEGAVTLVDEPR